MKSDLPSENAPTGQTTTAQNDALDLAAAKPADFAQLKNNDLDNAGTAADTQIAADIAGHNPSDVAPVVDAPDAAAVASAPSIDEQVAALNTEAAIIPEVVVGSGPVQPSQDKPAEAEKPRLLKSANAALRPEPGTPPPPKKRKRSRHARSQIVVFANFMLSLLVLLVLAASALFYFGKMQFEAAGPSATETTFFVKRGSGIGEIADGLERNDLISEARIFHYGVRAYGLEQSMKAGEYIIPAHASMRQIMNIFVDGKALMHSVTIPEGLTVQQVFDRIANNSLLVGDLPKELPVEGSLMAETFSFTRGATREEVVNRLQTAQSKLVDEIWAKRRDDLPVKDKNEFLTLASIVEKETGVASERPHVASVFSNRLKQGMRLQSDPTIIYGIFGGRGKPSDRPIYKSDIEKPTAYNTYIIKGLPPAPIANPGRDALEAVANPLDTKDLYFVADGTGGHVFAATLKEHNENVRKWRAVEKQRKLDAGNTSTDEPDQPAP